MCLGFKSCILGFMEFVLVQFDTITRRLAFMNFMLVFMKSLLVQRDTKTRCLVFMKCVFVFLHEISVGPMRHENAMTGFHEIYVGFTKFLLALT